MLVTSFSEKPQSAGQEINGGFFVFEPEIKEYLNEDKDCVLEEEPLKTSFLTQICTLIHIKAIGDVWILLKIRMISIENG